MKRPLLWFAATAAIVILFLQLYRNVPETSVEAKEEKEGKYKVSGAHMQMATFWWTRAYPDPTYINRKYMQAWEKAKQMRADAKARTSRVQAGAWIELGPKTLGGRILTVAINPVRRSTIWAGSASGGIWRSYSAGVGTNNWQHIETGFPALGVTSILVHPTDTSTIYAATGEVYRTDSTGSTPNPGNTSYNVWKTRGTYSVGMLKSEDAGATWNQVFMRDLSDMFGIQIIRFHPTDPNIVFICGTDGLYRYNDGTGVAEKIFNANYVSDVMINPDNPNVIIAAVGNLENSVKGVFRTTNGSNSSPSWSKITSGLPSSIAGYIRFNMHESSRTVYASFGLNASTEIYRTTNFGSSWQGISNSGHAQFQHWFAHDCAVDPNNVNRLYIMGVNKYRLTISSTTGTRTAVGGGSAYMNSYIAPGGQEGSSSYVHDDVHDIVFVPGKSDSMYVCTDGGIFLTTNAHQSTPSFQSCNSGLQTAQFYGPVAQSQTDENFFAGGLQDNNTAVYNGSTGRWKRSIGGDGGPAAVKPDNDNIVLASRDARAVYRSTDKMSSTPGSVLSSWAFAADSRTGFMAPIAWSQSNTNIVYIGTDNLHKSTNAGSSFSYNNYGSANNYIEAIRKTTVALAVSPIDDDVVIASTSPFAQYDNDVNDLHYNPPANLMKTTTGNTPFSSIYGAGLPTPARYVMDIAFHPSDDDIIWVVMGGFGSSHVFKTTDGGTTWQDMDNGQLPDVPTNAILLDPSNPNTIYVGNDIGVYVSSNGGNTWYDFSDGLWDATIIMDLVAVPNNKIRAATHGKGLFETVRYSGTLPANLIEFAGSNRGEYNELRWITSQESDLSHYELERSADGVRFEKIADISARNSSGTSHYSHNDPVAATRSLLNYYRLKTVDQNGSFKYSNIVLIRNQGKQSFQVVGNPFHDRLTIQYSTGSDQKVETRLLASDGRLLRIDGFQTGTGTGVYDIGNLQHLPTGTYMLQLVSATETRTFRVVKK